MKIAQIITFLFLIGITSSKAQNTAVDSSFIKVFNESEMKDLEKIQSFFLNKICLSNKPETDVIECYKNYFENIGKGSVSGNLDLMIPFTDQIKIYKEINKSTFNEIWVIEKLNNKINGNEYERIQINLDGKYAKFLKELSLEYSELKDYYEFLESKGDYSISAISQYYGQIPENEIIKLKDDRMSFISTIYFLTLNDQLLRN